MTYVINPPNMGIDLTANTEVPQFPLGMRVQASDQAEYQYVKNSGTASVAYSAYLIEETGILSTGLTTTNAGAIPNRVGICQTALTADYYGWILVKGPGKVNTAAAASADVKLYTTATAGKVDDAATTLIEGLRLTAAATGADTGVACYAVTDMSVNTQS